MPGWYDPLRAGPRKTVGDSLEGSSTVDFLGLLNQEKNRQSDDEAETELMPASEGYRYADGWHRSKTTGMFYRGESWQKYVEDLDKGFTD